MIGMNPRCSGLLLTWGHKKRDKSYKHAVMESYGNANASAYSSIVVPNLHSDIYPGKFQTPFFVSFKDQIRFRSHVSSKLFLTYCLRRNTES